MLVQPVAAGGDGLAPCHGPPRDAAPDARHQAARASTYRLPAGAGRICPQGDERCGQRPRHRRPRAAADRRRADGRQDRHRAGRLASASRTASPARGNTATTACSSSSPPIDNPRYAGAVVIEHGGGSGAAYPIARDVMTFLFDPAKGMEALTALEKQWGGTAQQRLDARYAAYAAERGASVEPPAAPRRGNLRPGRGRSPRRRRPARSDRRRGDRAASRSQSVGHAAGRRRAARKPRPPAPRRPAPAPPPVEASE